MNTNLLRTILVAAVASNAIAAEIPAGTHLLLRMENTINTKTAKPGDGVHMRTVTPLAAGGKMLVPIGSYAQGVVVRAEGAGLGHRSGDLQIRLETLMLPSGQVIRVSAPSSALGDELYRSSSAHRYIPGIVLASILAGIAAGGETGARIGIGAAAGTIIIPMIVGRGREIDLRQGATLDVAFNQAVDVQD